jgi:RNA 3'-terminal phosphate cyclase (ATP)
MKREIFIDGRQMSGSGTIVRDAVSWCGLTRKTLELINIRGKRKIPGLRAQHVKCIQAVTEICHGTVSGDVIGSERIYFRPGVDIRGNSYHWEIGTAGSAVMLASCLLSLSVFADAPSTHEITGGLFQDYAPSAFHFKNVLLPILRKMGVEADLYISRAGYVPKGKGKITLSVKPLETVLKPLQMMVPGKIRRLSGVSLASHLGQRNVATRMYESFRNAFHPGMEVLDVQVCEDTRAAPAFDEPAVQPGACLAVWVETDAGCRIGADMAGARGRSAELIGETVAQRLLADMTSGATVDRFLADQLIPFCALADGISSYKVPRLSEHVASRTWLCETILGARTTIENNRVIINGVGFKRK